MKTRKDTTLSPEQCEESHEQKRPMRDTTAFGLSLLFLVILCVPVLLGVGIARGWNVSLTEPRKFEFKTVEDATRFWPEPNAYEENAEIDASLPGRDFDAASSLWYYWKYRPSSTDFCQPGEFDPVTEPYTMSCGVPQANAGTRAFVWSCYLIHQCVVWGLIYKAQSLHKDDTKYHSRLRWYNVYSLVANAGFYVLHLIQTHVTYDALAQDVTEASSQASVIVLLVMVLVMDYKHRGLFLGWPAWNDPANFGCRGCNSGCRGWGPSWRLPTPPVELVRKYHGYAFSWATIYTLWYHPMESTAAHVTGFLHTGMLLIQQGLIFTPMHLNKYWRLVLEVWVAIHGSVVAAQTQGRGMIGMFLFGFLWMAAFTQVHGLPYYLAFVPVAERERLSKKQQAKESDENSGKNDDAEADAVAGAEATSSEPGSETSRRLAGAPSTSSLAKFVPYVPSSRWKRYVFRLVPGIIYFIFVVASYQTWLNRDDQTLGVQMTEITRIPLILYLMAVAVAIIGWGMMTASGKVCYCCGASRDMGVGVENGEADEENEGEEDGTTKEKPEAVLERSFRQEDNATNGVTEPEMPPVRAGVGSLGTGTVLAALFIGYAVMVAISVAIEAVHVEMNLIMLMVVLVAIFSVLALLVMIVMEKDMKRIELGPPQLPTPEDEEKDIAHDGGGVAVTTAGRFSQTSETNKTP